MPLQTQIVRNGTPLKLRWSEFHISAMVLATVLDSGKGPFAENTLAGILTAEAAASIDYPNDAIPIHPRDTFRLASYPIIGATPLNADTYTLQGRHKFVDTTDGEIFELLPGDELSAYRTL